MRMKVFANYFRVQGFELGLRITPKGYLYISITLGWWLFFLSFERFDD